MPESPKTLDKRKSIYQLKIHLLKVSPMIWRRIQVRGDTTIAELHYIIQLVMGWSDEHLNCFTINGRKYGVYHDGGLQFTDNSMEVYVSDLQLKKNRKFSYTYNFTVQWVHEIRVEDILPESPDSTYPICLTGKRACPPEIVWGPDVYPIFLGALSSFQFEMIQALEKLMRGKDSHLGRIEEAYIDRGDQLWEHRFFNPERFVVKETNQFLEQLYQKKGDTYRSHYEAYQELVYEMQWY